MNNLRLVVCFCTIMVPMTLCACKTWRKTVRNENKVNIFLQSVYERFLKFPLGIMSEMRTFCKEQDKET